MVVDIFFNLKAEAIVYAFYFLMDVTIKCIKSYMAEFLKQFLYFVCTGKGTIRNQSFMISVWARKC